MLDDDFPVPSKFDVVAAPRKVEPPRLLDVHIETLFHLHQRYDTLGDWLWNGRHLTVRVSRMMDWRKQFLLMMHELTEAALCVDRGITQNEVDEWDFSHPESDEPGEVAGAPYLEEHRAAKEVEQLLCRHFGMDYFEYERSLQNGEEGSDALERHQASVQAEEGDAEAGAGEESRCAQDGGRKREEVRQRECGDEEGVLR